MFVQMDARSVLSVVFRQFWKFAVVFSSVILLGILYLLLTSTAYTSTAKVVVKFGQDARPDMVVSENRSGLSAEEKRGMVQSNLNILLSRDLAAQLFTKVPVKDIYPDLDRDGEQSTKSIAMAADRFLKHLDAQTESNAGLIEVGFTHHSPNVAEKVLDQYVALFITQQSEIFGNPQAKVIRQQADTAYERLAQANKEFLDFKTAHGVGDIDEEISLLIQRRSDITSYLSQYNQDGATPVPMGEPSYDPAVDGAAPQDDVVPGADAGQPVMPPPAKGFAPKDAATIDDKISVDDSGTATVQIGKLSENDLYRILPAKKGVDGNHSPFPALDQSLKRIDELKAKRNDLLQTYRPDSDMVVNIDRTIETESEAMAQSVLALRSKLDELDTRIKDLNGVKAEYDVIARKVSLAEETFKTAQSRVQAAEVNDDLNNRKITQISVIEKPSLPDGPSKPKKALTLLLCILIGGLLGSSLVVLSELFDLSFSSPEQLSGHIKLPLLGVMSYNVLSADGRVVPLDYCADNINRIRVFVGRYIPSVMPAPKSAAISPSILLNEEVAALYQSLTHHAPGDRSTIFGFVSAYRGEGVSTIGWELSDFAASKVGRKVLFVDTVNAFVNDPSVPALLDVVAGKARLEEAVRTSKTVSGAQVAVVRFFNEGDRHQVLAQLDALKAQFAALSSQFDLIVLPVSGVVSDPVAQALSTIAHSVALVVEADRTRAPVVKQSLRLIEEGGTRIAGTILNKRIFYIPKPFYRFI